jgi:hypothetical protein
MTTMTTMMLMPVAKHRAGCTSQHISGSRLFDILNILQRGSLTKVLFTLQQQYESIGFIRNQVESANDKNSKLNGLRVHPQSGQHVTSQK